MSYEKINKYLTLVKVYLDNKESHDNKNKELERELDTLWNSMSDEETLAVDQLFSIECSLKQKTGKWTI